MRPLRVRVGRRRGLTCPDALAAALTDYLMGRTNRPPIIRLSDPRRRP